MLKFKNCWGKRETIAHQKIIGHWSVEIFPLLLLFGKSFFRINKTVFAGESHEVVLKSLYPIFSSVGGRICSGSCWPLFSPTWVQPSSQLKSLYPIFQFCWREDMFWELLAPLLTYLGPAPTPVKFAVPGTPFFSSAGGMRCSGSCWPPFSPTWVQPSPRLSPLLTFSSPPVTTKKLV